MTAEHDGCVIATARYSAHAAADGQDAWIVSSLLGRAFSRNQAITAMVLAERLAAGYSEDDLLATSPVFALLCVAAQGAGVPRWSRTMATASRWVNPEPVENA